MALTLALAGDTMLGRGVGERLATGESPQSLVAPEVARLLAEADLTLLNLECCISERGEPWPDPRKPYFFRAPPIAIETLRHLGVDVVTLANNHALDFGAVALHDTRRLLDGAGIRHVGAGPSLAAARAPLVVDVGGMRIGLVAFSDHPAAFAASAADPGIAHADLREGVPSWLSKLVTETSGEVDVLIVTPHWGPNMTAAPLPHLRRAADELVASGATLIAGHSAHVFHGVSRAATGALVLHDLGDFLDDYAVDPQLRNDRGLVWLVTLDDTHAPEVEVLPIALDFAYTRLADARESAWIAARLSTACDELGTAVVGATPDGRLRIGAG